MTLPDRAPEKMWDKVLAKVAGGERFAGLHATAVDGGLVLTAHVATDDDVEMIDADVEAKAKADVEAGVGADVEAGAAAGAAYPALTPSLRAAFWYEREIHDLFGIVPAGHPRLDPLLLPARAAVPPRPGPGVRGMPAGIDPDEHAVPRHVIGPGLFTIPHGPVRSGVFESVEFLVETPGEDIPHLNIRPFYKHRGIEKRFEQLPAEDGVLLAERVEGIASVAHALAYCHALERMTGCRPPWRARLVRVLHAELERVANHLDVAVKLADAAGLAVATARMGWHKERVLRLVDRLCGSRFGRGVVVPGGVAALPRTAPGELLTELGRLQKGIDGDARALMDTSSFLDRLRATGPLPAERAAEHGALGPVGRASGVYDDARTVRAYDAYDSLAPPASAEHRRRGQGDALARLRVRWEEIAGSFHLLRQATDELADADGHGDGGGALREPMDLSGGPAGRAIGWAEAPQGELLYEVWLAEGRIVRCRPRSASFHNLALFHEVFTGDILTDFPFIEASFGISVAGVAR
jgi:formate hydrogenlyase subunit 5